MLYFSLFFYFFFLVRIIQKRWIRQLIHLPISTGFSPFVCISLDLDFYIMFSYISHFSKCIFCLMLFHSYSSYDTSHQPIYYTYSNDFYFYSIIVATGFFIAREANEKEKKKHCFLLLLCLLMAGLKVNIAIYCVIDFIQCIYYS